MDNKVVTVDIFRGRPMGYCTAEEFAKACGVSKNTIRVWIRRGKLKWVLKIGNDWWIDVSNEKPGRKKRIKKEVPNEPRYFVEEIAEILEVNPETVRRWIRNGQLKSDELLNRKRGYMVKKSDLEEFCMTRSTKRIKDIWITKGL